MPTIFPPGQPTMRDGLMFNFTWPSEKYAFTVLQKNDNYLSRTTSFDTVLQLRATDV